MSSKYGLACSETAFGFFLVPAFDGLTLAVNFWTDWTVSAVAGDTATASAISAAIAVSAMRFMDYSSSGDWT